MVDRAAAHATHASIAAAIANPPHPSTSTSTSKPGAISARRATDTGNSGDSATAASSPHVVPATDGECARCGDRYRPLPALHPEPAHRRVGAPRDRELPVDGQGDRQHAGDRGDEGGDQQPGRQRPMRAADLAGVGPLDPLHPHFGTFADFVADERQHVGVVHHRPVDAQAVADHREAAATAVGVEERRRDDPAGVLRRRVDGQLVTGADEADDGELEGRARRFVRGGRVIEKAGDRLRGERRSPHLVPEAESELRDSRLVQRDLVDGAVRGQPAGDDDRPVDGSEVATVRTGHGAEVVRRTGNGDGSDRHRGDVVHAIHLGQALPEVVHATSVRARSRPS